MPALRMQAYEAIDFWGNSKLSTRGNNRPMWLEIAGIGEEGGLERNEAVTLAAMERNRYDLKSW